MEDYSVVVNYQSLLLNIFSLAPPKYFSLKFSRLKYRRNRLLRVSFIEL